MLKCISRQRTMSENHRYYGIQMSNIKRTLHQASQFHKEAEPFTLMTDYKLVQPLCETVTNSVQNNYASGPRNPPPNVVP